MTFNAVLAASGDVSMFATPDFWVLVAFVLFMGLLAYYSVPRIIGKMLDDRADGSARTSMMPARCARTRKRFSATISARPPRLRRKRRRLSIKPNAKARLCARKRSARRWKPWRAGSNLPKKRSHAPRAGDQRSPGRRRGYRDQDGRAVAGGQGVRRYRSAVDRSEHQRAQVETQLMERAPIRPAPSVRFALNVSAGLARRIS